MRFKIRIKLILKNTKNEEEYIIEEYFKKDYFFTLDTL